MSEYYKLQFGLLNYKKDPKLKNNNELNRILKSKESDIFISSLIFLRL